tara:strand:+ start:2906 stop:3283 length:378 start_codon:yes stop_codon:yes gene_type:complete
MAMKKSKGMARGGKTKMSKGYARGGTKAKMGKTKLAAMYGDKNKITRGDIITAAKKKDKDIAKGEKKKGAVTTAKRGKSKFSGGTSKATRKLLIKGGKNKMTTAKKGKTKMSKGYARGGVKKGKK